MKKILIPAGENSPEVLTDIQEGLFSITGVMCPENPIPFFTRLESCFDEFVYICNREKTVVFQLIYFNSSSARLIYRFLKRISSVGNIRVAWYYEEGDTDLLESGQDYAELTGLSFDFVAYHPQ